MTSESGPSAPIRPAYSVRSPLRSLLEQTGKNYRLDNPSKLSRPARCIFEFIDEHDQATRILLVRLHGTVHHHVRLHPAQDARRDVALAAVAELGARRPDRAALLAEIAGIMPGTTRWSEDTD